MDRISGKLDTGQGEMKIFMAKCVMCVPGCDVVTESESFKVRKNYS